MLFDDLSVDENLFLKINQFVNLSDADRKVTERLFLPRTLQKGEYFLRAGAVSREIAFVQTGIFRHFLERAGDELIYAFAAENDFVSDYESFLSATATDKNIQAVETVCALVINRRNLEIFYREVEHGERFGRLALEQIFVGNLRQIVSLYRNTPAERYRDFVAEYRAILERVPLKRQSVPQCAGAIDNSRFQNLQIRNRKLIRACV